MGDVVSLADRFPQRKRVQPNSNQFTIDSLMDIGNGDFVFFELRPYGFEDAQTVKVAIHRDDLRGVDIHARSVIHVDINFDQPMAIPNCEGKAFEVNRFRVIVRGNVANVNPTPSDRPRIP